MTHRFALVTLVGLGLATAGPPGELAGQVRPRVSGELGTFGELYGVSGREPRRPGSTGRLFFTPTFSFSEHFSVGFDFQLSTEGSDALGGATSPTLARARQRLNQFGVAPAWQWGRANLGDFADSYSPLTFSGVRVRGAGITVTPGIIRFSMFGGSARRSVIGGATNGSYDRSIAGGRIGVGKEDGTNFGLIVVRASDDPTSLPAASDTAFIDPRFLDDPTLDPDTLPVGTLVNPLSVTPQENLVVAGTGRVRLGPVTWSGEVSASAYTRDVRASAIDNEQVLDEFPGIVRGLFTPRISSNVSVAHTNELSVRFGSVTAAASHRYIPPGYVSLGLASLLNDRRIVRLNGSARIGRRVNVRWDGSRQGDNLADQKSFTTVRYTTGGVVDTRVSQRWRATVRANYITLGNDLGPGDARRVAYDNWIFASNHTFSVARTGLLRNIGMGYTFRTSGDENPARRSADLTAHGVDIRTLFAPTDRLSVSPSVGLVTTRQGDRGRSTRATYAIAGQLRALEGRWNTSLSLGRTQDRAIRVSQARVNSRYRLTELDNLTFALRASRYDNAPNPLGTAGDFDEFILTFRWGHRFGGRTR